MKKGLIGISILALSLSLSAQTFRLNSNVVLVQVSVTDRNNHPVLGLEQDRFQILEDHVEKPLEYFGRDDASLSVGMILDVSGSIGPALGKVRDALARFCEVANPEDEFFLVTVSSTPTLLQPFTNQCGNLQAKMFRIPSGGNTSLLDGIAMGLDQLKKAHNTRRALFVVTDGQDNHSRFTQREVMNMALEADAQIYMLGLPATAPTTFEGIDLDGTMYFEELAAVTGGKFFPIIRKSQIPDTAKTIGEELHNQYVLGYRASAVVMDGKFHRILVKLNPLPGGPKLIASYRSGYYAR